MGVYLCGRSLQFGPDEESLISGSLRLGQGRSVSRRPQNGDSDKLSLRKPRQKLVYTIQIGATGIFFSSLLGQSGRVLSVVPLPPRPARPRQSRRYRNAVRELRGLFDDQRLVSVDKIRGRFITDPLHEGCRAKLAIAAVTRLTT